MSAVQTLELFGSPTSTHMFSQLQTLNTQRKHVMRTSRPRTLSDYINWYNYVPNQLRSCEINISLTLNIDAKIHTHARTHTKYIQTCINTSIDACRHTYIDRPTHIHKIHTNKHTYKQVCMHTNTYARTHIILYYSYFSRSPTVTLNQPCVL